MESPPLPRIEVAADEGAAGLPDLPYVPLTQRHPPPPERRGMWILLAVVVLLHVAAGIWYLLLRPAPAPAEAQNVIQITLIVPPAALPPPPPGVMPPPLPGQPPPPPPPVRHAYVPPAKGAMQATLESPKGRPLHLYGANGQIIVPPTSAPPAPPSAYQTPELQGSHIYSGKSPVPYKPTRFAKDFAPTNRSLGAKGAAALGRLYDKAAEKTSVGKTIHLPGGIKIHCAIVPLFLGAGCAGQPPQPPPKNDDDIRLSMPPPVTLTGKKVPVPASASSVPPPASR